MYEMTGVIAHRGAMLKKTENTLEAFQLAIDEGATGLELDLRMTQDGHIVAIHDKTVERTTDGSGPVSELTLEQVRGLRGSGGEVVPALEEILDFLVPTQLTWVLFELKAAGQQEQVGEAVSAAGLAERAYLFNQLSESQLDLQSRQVASIGCSRGRLAFCVADEHRRLLIARDHLVDAEIAARAADLGTPAFVVTGTEGSCDPQRLRRAVADGVGGIIGDDPLLLRQVVDGFG